MIVIIDYGLGNLRSVAGAVEKLGYQACVSNRIDDLENANKLILPGVGAFGDGMKNLRELNLIEPLTKLVVRQTKPLLGICLGAQLLTRESCEFGDHKGLGWIDASVVRIEGNGGALRVPHVGWNHTIQVRNNLLFKNIPSGALFYYVHSFHIRCANPEIVIGECDYGGRLTAAFQYQNIYAVQFHPEKSQWYGLKLLKNFLDKA